MSTVKRYLKYITIDNKHSIAIIAFIVGANFRDKRLPVLLLVENRRFVVGIVRWRIGGRFYLLYGEQGVDVRQVVIVQVDEPAAA